MTAYLVPLIFYLSDCMTGAGWTSDWLGDIPPALAAHWQMIGHMLAVLMGQVN